MKPASVSAATRKWMRSVTWSPQRSASAPPWATTSTDEPGRVPISGRGVITSPLGVFPAVGSAGRELVFDPGTPSYHGKSPWRGMDRGTRAHPMETPTRPEWVGPRAHLVVDEP